MKLIVLSAANAPGPGTPSHGSFLYYEVLEILQGFSAQVILAGMDLVEITPDYDQTGSPAFLVAQSRMRVFLLISSALKVAASNAIDQKRSVGSNALNQRILFVITRGCNRAWPVGGGAFWIVVVNNLTAGRILF